jgi:hypothetical protein
VTVVLCFAGISAAALAVYMATLLYRVVSSITKSATAGRFVLLSQRASSRTTEIA